MGPMAPTALLLAIAAGAVTSALGYALWYTILPRLGAQRAAIAQLTVPLIAAGAGVAVLAETVDARFAVAAILILGGIWWSLRPPGRT